MSFISKMFGGSPKDKALTPQDAIQQLRETEEMMLKKSEFLETKIEDEVNIARKAGVKNKRVALAALKKKKRLEKSLQQIDGTLSTIELQREALENATTNTQVLKVMGSAAKALKSAHQNLDVDKVHDLMDDISEQHEIANEIGGAFANPMGYNQDIDEDDLLAELEEMEQEGLDEQLLQVGGETENFPSVPTAEPGKKVPATGNKDDDDMKELEMWAT